MKVTGPIVKDSPTYMPSLRAALKLQLDMGLGPDEAAMNVLKTTSESDRVHLTASAVIRARNGRLLLIHHRSYNRWLFPGGHAEGGESLLSCAMREAEEEVGLAGSAVSYIRFIGFDVHAAHPEQHWMSIHIDARFEMVLSGDFVPACYSAEVVQHAWFDGDVAELKHLNPPDDVSRQTGATAVAAGDLIERVSQDIGPWAPRFFEASVPLSGRDIAVILVAHAVRGVSGLALGLERVGRIAAVIVKPNSADESQLEWLQGRYKTVTGSRKHMLEKDVVLDLVKNTVNPNGEFLIADVGGYFAPHIAQLARVFGDRFLGVIEDTENGLQRYESLPSIDSPVLSIARSEIKLPEDQMIGRWLFQSWRSACRDLGRDEGLETPLILGFGKIGAGIASALVQSGFRPRIVEPDPLRALDASSRGYDVVDVAQSLSAATSVFSATGNHSLGLLEAPALASDVLIVAATSRDDEFDFEGLVSDWELADTGSSGLQSYRRPDGSRVWFLNRGNSANFAYPDLVEVEYLAPSHAALALAASQLSLRLWAPGLRGVERAAETHIAEEWLASQSRPARGD